MLNMCGLAVNSLETQFDVSDVEILRFCVIQRVNLEE